MRWALASPSTWPGTQEDSRGPCRAPPGFAGRGPHCTHPISLAVGPEHSGLSRVLSTHTHPESSLFQNAPGPSQPIYVLLPQFPCPLRKHLPPTVPQRLLSRGHGAVTAHSAPCGPARLRMREKASFLTVLRVALSAFRIGQTWLFLTRHCFCRAPSSLCLPTLPTNPSEPQFCHL